jgi:hypothetical protein
MPLTSSANRARLPSSAPPTANASGSPVRDTRPTRCARCSSDGSGMSARPHCFRPAQPKCAAARRTVSCRPLQSATSKIYDRGAGASRRIRREDFHLMRFRFRLFLFRSGLFRNPHMDCAQLAAVNCILGALASGNTFRHFAIISKSPVPCFSPPCAPIYFKPRIRWKEMPWKTVEEKRCLLSSNRAVVCYADHES